MLMPLLPSKKKGCLTAKLQNASAANYSHEAIPENLCNSMWPSVVANLQLMLYSNVMESNNKTSAFDRRYLRMAAVWAENSYCVRRKVGALIVKDKMIISDGFNGTPSGFENVCEDADGLTKSYGPRR